MHRIREAMRDGSLAPFGGGGGVVEADETFIGRDPDAAPKRRGSAQQDAVLTLVDRTAAGPSSFVPSIA